jgi:hypothetical protein
VAARTCSTHVTTSAEHVLRVHAPPCRHALAVQVRGHGTAGMCVYVCVYVRMYIHTVTHTRTCIHTYVGVRGGRSEGV